MVGAAYFTHFGALCVMITLSLYARLDCRRSLILMEKQLLLITYTIYEGDDTDLVNRLERADSYELDETAWLVYTEETARWWYNQLEPMVYEEDELLVLKISIHEIATDDGLRDDLQQWLDKRR